MEHEINMHFQKSEILNPVCLAGRSIHPTNPMVHIAYFHIIYKFSPIFIQFTLFA